MSGSRMLGHVEHHRVHVGVVPPSIARELFFVSRYDVADPASNAADKHGYQRPPTESRYPEIARYFTESGHRFLITPLAVSVRIKEPTEIDRFIRLFEANDVSAIKGKFGSSVVSV